MNNEEKQKYAGFWVRLASIFIDGIFVSAFSVSLTVILMIFSHQFVSSETFLKLSLFIFVPFALLPGFLYYSWFNANGKQTIGKRIFGLLVVNNKFEPISIRRSLFRSLIFIFDSLIYSIGNLLILVTKKNQTFHDLITKTYVINKDFKNRSGWKYFLIIIVTISIGYFYGLFLHSYIQAFTIPTSAMEETLLVGDFILVDKVDGNKYFPKSGDVIVFKYPRNKNLAYIKRCIALGGQTLEIINKKVYVDGELYPLPDLIKFIDRNTFKKTEGKFLFPTFQDLGSRDNFGPIIIPENHYFVMGDNRDNSSDSRVWGFVSQEDIIGRAGLIYFSWDSQNNSIRWNRIGKWVK